MKEKLSFFFLSLARKINEKKTVIFLFFIQFNGIIITEKNKKNFLLTNLSIPQQIHWGWAISNNKRWIHLIDVSLIGWCALEADCPAAQLQNILWTKNNTNSDIHLYRQKESNINICLSNQMNRSQMRSAMRNPSKSNKQTALDSRAPPFRLCRNW